MEAVKLCLNGTLGSGSLVTCWNWMEKSEITSSVDSFTIL